MLADACAVRAFILFETISVKVDEAGVQSPAAGNIDTIKTFVHDVFRLVHDLRKSIGVVFRAHAAVFDSFGRMIVVEASELPVAEPINRTEQGALILSWWWGIVRRESLLPDGVQGCKPIAQASALLFVQVAGQVDKAGVFPVRRLCELAHAGQITTSGLDPSGPRHEDRGRMKKDQGAPQVIKAIAGPEQKRALIDALPRLKGRKVLIIGDVGVDEYVMGAVRRISPEAPVPVLEVDAEDQRLGLAANISQNIVRLGGDALTVGVIGQDAGAETLRTLFDRQGVSTTHLVSDPTRPTTRKMRIMAQHHHLVRVDYEQTRYLSTDLEARVLEKARGLMAEADLVILQDYAKGVVSETLTQGLVHLCRQAGKRLLVDPHRSKGAEFYAGADLLKPNYDESVALSGLRFDDLKDNPNKVYDVGRALQAKAGAREIIVTRGKEGMTIFSGDKITEVPTYARRVFDVTGAGDTVIATLSLAMAAGLDLVQSCMLANFAAGVVVGKVGSVPCELPELIEYIQSSP